MAQTSALMRSGLPAAVAQQLGSSDTFTLEPTGTTQDTAAPIPGSYGFLFPVPAGTPAPGVKLPPASGAAQTVLYNADGANPANIYPFDGEILNSWPVNVPLKLGAGSSVIATPGDKGWILIVQSPAAAQGP
jgi:hypothetical protein